MISILLVIFGLVLILFEFYLPGAVLGVLGGVAILVGVILFASQSSLFSTLLFFAGTVIAVILIIRFAIWRIKNAKPQYSIYSNANQEGYQAVDYDKTAIGKSGIVVADLKPGGYILIEGKQYPAISIAGYISKGECITVISGQEQSLIVIPKKESKI